MSRVNMFCLETIHVCLVRINKPTLIEDRWDDRVTTMYTAFVMSISEWPVFAETRPTHIAANPKLPLDKGIPIIYYWWFTTNVPRTKDPIQQSWSPPNNRYREAMDVSKKNNDFLRMLFYKGYAQVTEAHEISHVYNACITDTRRCP